MLLTKVVSQYIKLSAGSKGGLLKMATKLLGRDTTAGLLQKLLTGLSPDLIQKLSALTSLGKNETTQVASQDNFIDRFKQLASQFSQKDTDEQITQLAKPENANYISSAMKLAKNLGINLDKLV